ncbi:MAG TPA: trigger factor [Candidatus Binataceae bacterium]|nr:trigger factor [Candidatus Binataceae bacterium]
MNVNIETTSALRRKMTIELESAEINRELDRAYNELKRSVVMKGFRPGHAPRNLLERFFGDQVRGDVIQKLVKEYTGKALEENDLTPIVEPEIVTEETDLKKALKFSAVFDLKPDFEVKDYQNLKVQRSTPEVADSDLADTLERMRERRGVLRKVEGRTTVAPDDFVIAGFEGYADGEPVTGTKFEERLLRVSKDALAHGLDEVLTGAELGVEVRKEREYPADYAEKEIAGKKIEWRATVKEIYERVLPLLDDEFAKDEGAEDLSTLRIAVRTELEAAAEREADARARQGLLDLIIERNVVEVPESLVAREQRLIEHELASAYEAGGVPREAALAKVRENPDEIKAQAEKRARAAMVVDAIADQENIEVTDDEVGDRVGMIVTGSGRSRERVAEHYSQEENRASLKQVMRREKTLDHLLKRAQAGTEEPAATVVEANERADDKPATDDPAPEQ